MAKTWEDDFGPSVAADMASCPYPTLVDAIRFAAIEFFNKTRAWVVDLDAIDVVANQQTYTLTSNVSETTVVAPRQVIWGAADDTNSRVLLPKTLSWLQDRYGDITQSSYDPSYYLADTTREVSLVPVPADAVSAGLRVKAAIKPTQASTGVDTDDIYEEYLEDIVFGARARLLMMRDKDWSDYQLGVSERASFEDCIARTRKRAAQQFVRAPLRGPAMFF
jgi:hypothetical protein